jgi:hypothetical protein
MMEGEIGLFNRYSHPKDKETPTYLFYSSIKQEEADEDEDKKILQIRNNQKDIQKIIEVEKRKVSQKFQDFKDYITDIRKESNSK